MGRGPRQINIVSVLLALSLLAACYFSYIYFPVVQKRSELAQLVEQSVYGVSRVSELDLTMALVKVARLELGIELIPEDITPTRMAGFNKLEVVWRPRVAWGFGYSYTHAFKVEKRRAVFN